MSGASDPSTDFTAVDDTADLVSGSVQAGWGDFLDSLPAAVETKAGKDSAPNHRLQLSETKTTATPASKKLSHPSQDNPSSSSAGSGVFRTRLEPAPSHANLGSSQVLPDDSKRNQEAGPLNAGPPPTHMSAGDSDLVDVGRDENLGREGDLGRQEDLVTTARAVTESGTGVSTRSEKDGERGFPAVEEKGAGSDWPVEEEEEEGTRRSGEGRSGDSDRQAQWHGVQIILLVAPCVGALLSATGAVCVVRFATASCCQRRKLIKGIRKQQKMSHQQQQQNELTTTQLEDPEDNMIHEHSLY